MRKGLWRLFTFVVVVVVFIAGVVSGSMGFFSSREKHVPSSGAVLVLDLEGIIADSDKFIRPLKKYRNQDRIKAVLVKVNSPGGMVGPSQEIYSELLRTRNEFKKPVVVACTSLAASGAYYSAVAANKIFANPGTLMGSIGVIMEFANLENLYDWAKIKRYAITTGAYKDSGAEYRPMRPDERQLFQSMLSQVHGQFKKAVSEGRKLPLAEVEKYADGRVFTGEAAVALGFADRLGTIEDALREAGKMGGIEGEPEIFEPPKKRPSIWQFVFSSDDEEDAEYRGPAAGFLRARFIGKPVLLMPGALLD